MFVALTKTNERISLVHSSNVVRDNPPYYCPVCQQEVVMKKGTKRRWHFAHRQSYECSVASAEPETEEHLAGKAELYKWLCSNGISPTIELFLPAIQRRADLFFTYRNQKYAIEFQCASISEKEALERTKDYLSEYIIPLWIFSSQRIRSLQPEPSRFSIHSFEWIGLRERHHDHQRALTYFSPSSSTFYFLFPQAVLTSTTTFADLYSLAAVNTGLSLIIRLPATINGSRDWRKSWLYKKKQWRYKRNDWRNHKDKYYARRLFASLRSDIPYFPGEAGWPVNGMEYVETSTHLWQSVFLLQLLTTIPLYHSFSWRTVVEAFSPIMSSQFTTRSLPLITNPLENSILGYLELLQKMKILHQTTTGWIRTEQIYLPRSLDEGFEMDKKRYRSIF
ncbi:hypothetical protein D7Z54_22250 [Salibacterium salarium]|uniref:Competence protein CoiA n=1 Tax=Salibacterium salarium TaxID=284579 RepID=A0A3R9QI68_9BACI|nr:competence protein CoiA family protein [Salibacterium salarium]RSL31230.1 hypothetical protein D7Z54_22250 [Salibacterium salarium]